MSSLGVPGLSAVGITSGLAALGSLVGGGLFAGVLVAAAIPHAMVGAGWGIVQLIKSEAAEGNLDSSDIDPRWEMSADE